MTAAGLHSHTPQSQFSSAGRSGNARVWQPGLPWLGFSVSEFKLAPGGARAPALQVWRGGACRWLGGAEATWRHLPTHRAQVAHVLQPSTCGEGGGAGGLEGAEALGATRALTWPQVAFGIYSRCFLHCSAPGAFCTVLPMATGGVSHLLQVLFGLFCSWSKWLKPPAFCAKAAKDSWRRMTISACVSCKIRILWLSGGTTRVRWRGACYLGPSMRGSRDPTEWTGALRRGRTNSTYTCRLPTQLS